jgi:hypothetical protein
MVEPHLVANRHFPHICVGIPYLPNVKPGPDSVEYVLPNDQALWAKSRPTLGLWVYSDPNGVRSPVRSLTIKRPAKKTPSIGRHLTSITMSAASSDLSRFVGAQLYRVDFDILGTEFRLSSLAQGVRPQLPPKKALPGDETEIEPYAPPSNNAQTDWPSTLARSRIEPVVGE